MLEDVYEYVTMCIHEAAKDVVGYQSRYQKRQPEWWTKKLEEKVKIKNLYQSWLRTQDNEDRKYYTRMNREVKRDVTKCKSDMWERCAQLVCYMGDSNIGGLVNWV